MKVNTTVSVDDYLLQKARAKQLNVSGILNDSLRLRTEATKKDVPEEAIKLECMQCGKSIEYGFLCEERDLFLCQECQDNSSMKCSAKDNHSHVRIPSFTDQNMDMIPKVEKLIKEKKERVEKILSL